MPVPICNNESCWFALSSFIVTDDHALLVGKLYLKYRDLYILNFNILENTGPRVSLKKEELFRVYFQINNHQYIGSFLSTFSQKIFNFYVYVYVYISTKISSPNLSFNTKQIVASHTKQIEKYLTAILPEIIQKPTFFQILIKFTGSN